MGDVISPSSVMPTFVCTCGAAALPWRGSVGGLFGEGCGTAV